MNSGTTLPNSTHTVYEKISAWYDQHKRDLPWRQPQVSGWAVLVSEVMLQQTPVARVIPIWHQWVTRWPTAKDCAAAPLSEVISLWGRLGYPRRAKWLHEAAAVIATEHHNVVPEDTENLRALPGVGEYTAAATSCFTYQQPTVVVDTNIRRVHARIISGKEYPDKSYSAAERALAHRLVADLPTENVPTWNISVMELGALVCTARSPDCDQCPLVHDCAWVACGSPAATAPRAKPQKYYGTDRYVRGLVLGLLRDTQRPATADQIAELWADQTQLHKATSSLIADGLITKAASGQLSLPV